MLSSLDAARESSDGLRDLPELPRRLGLYRDLRLVGRGGMGAVYEARLEQAAEPVALKVLHHALYSDAIAKERFLREGRLLTQLRHPNIIRVQDVGIASGLPFIAMEFLSGETLASLLAREGRLSVLRIVDIFMPLLSGVNAIHAASIVHRDLKLSNVMLAKRPTGAVEPVILDFGISKTSGGDDTSLTHSHALVGTLRYLSPEQMLSAKAASPLSDQYALGVMLYECATGRRAFTGSSQYELMHAILNERPRPPRELAGDLPPGFADLILRAMSRDPGQRFSDVRALGNALLAHGEARTWARWARAFHGGEVATDIVEDTHVDAADLQGSTALSPARPRPRAIAQPRWRISLIWAGLPFCATLALIGASSDKSDLALARGAFTPIVRTLRAVPSSTPPRAEDPMPSSPGTSDGPAPTVLPTPKVKKPRPRTQKAQVSGTLAPVVPEPTDLVQAEPDPLAEPH